MEPTTTSASTPVLSPAAAAVADVVFALDNLTIGDLELFDKLAAKGATNTEIVGLLERVIVGGVRHLPYRSLGPLVERLAAELKALGNPEAAEGN